MDPRTGTIELQSTTEVYNILSRKQERQLAFTSQSPMAKESRKRMRYLSGHSSVSTWPVQYMPLSQRLRTTLTQHDSMLDGQGGDDGEPSDEPTCTVQRLGSKVVPFSVRAPSSVHARGDQFDGDKGRNIP